MAMTTTEQNTIFQLTKTSNQALLLKTNETGATVYVLMQLTPVRQMTTAEAGAYATAIGTTIASP